MIISAGESSINIELLHSFLPPRSYASQQITLTCKISSINWKFIFMMNYVRYTTNMFCFHDTHVRTHSLFTHNQGLSWRWCPRWRKEKGKKRFPGGLVFNGFFWIIFQMSRKFKFSFMFRTDFFCYMLDIRCNLRMVPFKFCLKG